jgi:hypothetical protein
MSGDLFVLSAPAAPKLRVLVTDDALRRKIAAIRPVSFLSVVFASVH